jgi:hypothetical protein
MSNVGYMAVHLRIHRTQGSAKNHRCISCGVVAFDWCYDHSDPNELRDDRRCHLAYDRQHLRDMAEPFRAQVKDAVEQRDRARRHKDWDAERLWDDELERLTTLLMDIR